MCFGVFFPHFLGETIIMSTTSFPIPPYFYISNESVMSKLLFTACFTREGTGTIAVYGKHIFLCNFSLAIMLECFAT